MIDKKITELKGIGEKRAAIFQKKGITTVEDLLYFFPRTHEDRTKIKKLGECADGDEICFRAAVRMPPQTVRVRRSMTVTTMTVEDDTGSIAVVWYNNPYVGTLYRNGEEYVFFGKIIRDKRGKRQVVNPIIEEIGKERFTGKIVPIYPLSGSLTQKIVQSAMESALDAAGDIEEYILEDIRGRFQIAEINFAMRNIHFPTDAKSYEIARRRFVFDELLTLQLSLLSRKDGLSKADGIVIENTECCGDFINALPYKLTGAQMRTIGEILKDMSGGAAMNRLVQGDVGSGKTAVAAAAIYTAVKNGRQAVMMAPTEILARQHKETLDAMFDGMDIRVSLLTGGMKKAEKRRVYEAAELGTADVIIGTHAVIQDELAFRDLALVIADEQHRFGVEQRARLAAKGHNPHILIMSATPIPRTLALILYGDLDISVIDELPPGRKPVKTYAVGENMRRRIYAFVEKNVLAGSQAYIVCPLVEESEKSDLKNASDLCEALAASYPDIKIGLMHGKMRPKLKDEVMTEFLNGDIKILVSTTVIEVGVNVPNANVMVIENAERFGLSQLHQLRGRVGRGGDEAYCVMFAHGDNDVTKMRMKTMCASNDGFYISEQDLKLRGPGDFFGTRQHGLPEMKIANLFEDRDILKDAQDAARFILTEDGGINAPKYAALKKRAENLISDDVVMN
ncbi:MAG: ATP-dependent DNA helicase RecG [Firmicutes bacterium]|nr:ATP-dependent DNA helicase RecG [Bacillota bacterium]